MSHPRCHGVHVRALFASLLTLWLAGCSRSQDSSPAPGPTPGTPISYTAIGASDAIGIGSTVPCVPLTQCEGGRGYVPITARELGAGGSTGTLTNLGIPGAVLSPAIQTIGNQYNRGIPGNFLEQEMPFVPRATTLVTIFAGGNDANAIAAAVDRGAGGSDPNGYIDQQVAKFASDYAALVRGVRDRAPSARVIALNLPNLAGAPYTAGFTAAQRRYMQRISVGFSQQGANALASQGVVVVDLLCDSRSYDRANYSSDGFHPNDAGYAFMASEVVQAVRTAAFPPPQADCEFARK
jgi:lysophospholipase L1-like esterase